ncbi:hypothetical protein JW960_18665 [candidate division KSB1 bacterium]|nr:hypothetical protein [candidate division KSB1 bacterium]
MKLETGITFIYLLTLTSLSIAQTPHGDRTNRARNDHSGNQIRVTYWNHGMMGGIRNDNSLTYKGEWPINSGLIQMGNASSYVLSEVSVFDRVDEATGESLYVNITPAVCCQGWDPERFSHDGLGNFLGFEPLPGYLNADNPDVFHKSAMSDKPFTWPASWPDKIDDLNDPGWRGKWNGYFGKGIVNADQESYHVLDDYPFNKIIGGYELPLPIPPEPDRAGLGLRKSIRGLQWSNPRAEDCIFWIYDVKNIGELKLNKTIFGLNVGASMGALLGLNQSYDDDGATFYREIGLTVSYEPDNVGTQNYTPVPWVGFAFLESPGNAVDGVDNDGDGVDGSGRLITTADFMRYVGEGDPIVLIDYESADLKRTVETMPSDSIVFTANGNTYTKYANSYIDEIPRNGIDDNLNGIIDESDGAEITETGEVYYLYINNPIYNKQSYLAKDYITGDGLDNLLIDERRDDGEDNDGDWDPLTDDVGLDGAEGTGDDGEGDGVPTPGIGELPGEPNIDRVDVSESDQIGLTSFIFYIYGDVTYSNDDQMWLINRPGFFDGHLEKVDADYIFSTGYFPLMPGQREAFSIAMVYGWNEPHIINNKNTVQEIYDANYNFAVAPQLPTLTAVAGDGKVTLYWDDKSEESRDRYLGEYDFEGYKIYRATDPGFEDATTTVIDEQLGSYTMKTPIAVFDKIDGVHGFFPKANNYGIQYYLGSESGLVHTYVDSPAVNGRRYYYAITAYDRGKIEQNIYPSETTKYIAVNASGEIQEKGVNVVSVVPAAPALGYIPPEFDTYPQPVGDNKIGDGFVRLRVIEPDSLVGNGTYEIQFLDISRDYRDNDFDGLVDGNDPDELIPLETSGFILKDITDLAAPITLDTVWFKEFRWVDSTYADTILVDNVPIDTSRIAPALFELKNLYNDNDRLNTTLRAVTYGFEFFVYNPPATPGILNLVDENGDGIRNGVKWSANINPDETYLLNFGIWDDVSYVPGTFYPRQMKIVFFDDIADTSAEVPLKLRKYDITIKIPPIPANFKVYDSITGEQLMFGFRENQTNSLLPKGHFSAKDEIWFIETLSNDSLIVSFRLLNNSLNDSIAFSQYYGRNLELGDTLYLYSDFQFTSENRYRFTINGQKVDPVAAKANLDNIKVVPNPYVATSAWEAKNPYRSGRGPRQIQFIHLPPQCTIRIFAVDGTLIKKLEHNATITNGSEPWNLRTRDEMDIAYGLYIYHIDAPGIGEHVGRFIVIK